MDETLLTVFSLTLYGAAAFFALGLMAWLHRRHEELGKVKLFTLILRRLLSLDLLRGHVLLWLIEMAFRAALVIVFLRYLRFFMFPVPYELIELKNIGIYAAHVLPVLLFLSLACRSLTERGAAISSNGDYLISLLLIAIALSGLWFHYDASEDQLEIKAYTLGLAYLRIVPLPFYPVFILHSLLVAALAAAFSALRFWSVIFGGRPKAGQS